MNCTVGNVCDFLDTFAPQVLAEEWDNVGLLVGDRAASAARVMTCLTITPQSAAEAIAEKAQLIVSHHPLPFKPLKRITTANTAGKLLWQLASAGISIASPHTAFDSAAEGINQQWCQRLQLTDTRPLLPLGTKGGELLAHLGSGRQGTWPQAGTIQSLAAQVKKLFKLTTVQVVPGEARPIRKIGVACGSAGSFLEPARKEGCDCLITGETSFHTALEAEALGMGLILVGHYASERFAVESLAELLSSQFPSVHCWASRQEQDPLHWM